MLISVVVPLFNKASTIRRCVASVLSQTRLADEIVVVDDGSTDGSGDVVAEMHAPQVHLIRQERAGVSEARNRGIRESHGELIAFLDADDEWKPGFLDVILRLSQRYPEAGAFGAAYVFARNGRQSITEPAFSPSLPREGLLTHYFDAVIHGSIPILASAIAIRRSTFDVLGPFSADAAWGEDAEMWARIYLQYPIAYSRDRLVLYHTSAPNRATESVGARPMMPVVKTLEEALQLGRIRPAEASDAVRYICQAIANTVQTNILHGHRGLAAEQLKCMRRYRYGRRTYWRFKCLSPMPHLCIRTGLRARNAVRALFDAMKKPPQGSRRGTV